MEAEELRRLWDDARAGGEPAPKGAGLLGLHVVGDPAALTGMALVVLGLPLDASWTPGGVARVAAAGTGCRALRGQGRRLRRREVVGTAAVAFSGPWRLADIGLLAHALVLGRALVSPCCRSSRASSAAVGRGRLQPAPMHRAWSRCTRVLAWARAGLGVVSPATWLVGGRRLRRTGPPPLLDALSYHLLLATMRDGMAQWRRGARDGRRRPRPSTFRRPRRLAGIGTLSACRPGAAGRVVVSPLLARPRRIDMGMLRNRSAAAAPASRHHRRLAPGSRGQRRRIPGEKRGADSTRPRSSTPSTSGTHRGVIVGRVDETTLVLP
jgi:hypothetical protein